MSENKRNERGEMKVFDRVNNEIKEGDIVRMFHFVSTYRGRYEYMYKKVGKFDDVLKRFKVYHLDSDIEKINENYFMASKDDFINSVVVQRAKYHSDNLKRCPLLRD